MARSGATLRRLKAAAEFVGVYCLVVLVRALPMAVVEPVTRSLGRLLFLVLRGRRHIALENVGRALDHGRGRAARSIVRSSFGSFLLTAMPEVAKLRPHLVGPEARDWLRRRAPELEAIFERARRLHDEARGCVFVTPHVGNWEILPDVAAAVGIPLAVVMRPLDSRYLERLLLGSRRASGQVFVAKRNSLMTLQQHLAAGRSIGMLPDQATYGGIPVEFLGRPAWTTPVPALLAVRERRPIVVVACFRTGRLRFAGHLGEPLSPQPHTSEKAEVIRLTGAMTRAMEAVIRAHPEQYLWMHNRWKDCSR
jgi:KDO2-lipid IV(A) lauroyltransferase